MALCVGGDSSEAPRQAKESETMDGFFRATLALKSLIALAAAGCVLFGVQAGATVGAGA